MRNEVRNGVIFLMIFALAFFSSQEMRADGKAVGAAIGCLVGMVGAGYYMNGRDTCGTDQPNNQSACEFAMSAEDFGVVVLGCGVGGALGYLIGSQFGKKGSSKKSFLEMDLAPVAQNYEPPERRWFAAQIWLPALPEPDLFAKKWAAPKDQLTLY